MRPSNVGCVFPRNVDSSFEIRGAKRPHAHCTLARCTLRPNACHRDEHDAYESLSRSAHTYDFLATPQHTQFAESHMERRTDETAIGLLHNNHIDCASQRCTIYFIVELLERLQQTIHCSFVSFLRSMRRVFPSRAVATAPKVYSALSGHTNTRNSLSFRWYGEADEPNIFSLLAPLALVRSTLRPLSIDFLDSAQQEKKTRETLSVSKCDAKSRLNEMILFRKTHRHESIE